MTAATILPTPPRFPRLLLPVTLPADPTDLAAAVEAGAFTGLRAAVEKLTSQDVIKAIAESGMLGRGGPGPGRSAGVGEKWRICAGTAADQHYVVVNAYQSDPAVLTDRVLLENNPFAVLEGAAIAAFAIGASEVIVAVRVEAVDTLRVLETAIAAAEEAGYLGSSVLGTGTPIHVSVKPLQGAYMLGEETVLLKGLEGKRGQPEQQPPYTMTRGLFGKPTLIHGPQTFAAIPTILNGGLAGFDETSPRAFAGTVLVQLSGAVALPGIAEVPFGATLREIVDVAGGVPASHHLKAVLVGGPSGGILPADGLDVIFDHESLEKAGAHLGSGSIVVIDQHSCVVDLAAVLTRFCADEACGKTIPCRIGLRRLAEIGARFCDGQPRGDDVTRLLDLSHDIVESALCDHERRATLALQSVVRYFRDELDAHILRNSCPAGICHPKAETRAGRSSEASHA
jgi:NADH:ubiquinone oxidoreductase subunit F (NADH-binding)